MERSEAPGPGIYEGVPFGEYLRWPYLSMSALKVFAESPAQLVYEQAREEKEGREVSDAMRIGSAVDRMVFDGKEAFDAGFIACPAGMKRDERHKEYQAFMARAEGREVLKAADFEMAKWIATAVMMHPLLSGGKMKGKTQVSVVWDDPETGLRCKARPDIYQTNTAEPIIWDLKVTTAPKPGEFEKQAQNQRWHWQSKWYLTALSEITGFGHRCFRDIAVRSTQVHSVHIHEFSPDFLALAESEYRPLVRQYAELQAVPRSEWPAGGDDINIADPHYRRWS